MKTPKTQAEIDKFYQKCQEFGRDPDLRDVPHEYISLSITRLKKVMIKEVLDNDPFWEAIEAVAHAKWRG